MCMKVLTSEPINNMHVNFSLSIMFLPPILEWGLGDEACALLRMVQSAPRRWPSCGSRCPGLRLQPPSPGAQSPGEWWNLLGTQRCPGVGTTKGPSAAKPHRQRAEGTLGRPPGLKKASGHHQSHTHLLRCQTSKGQTHRPHHLREKQTMWG